MRPYDRTLDHYYSPDDTSDIFLTEEQVKSALQKIPLLDSPEEIDVRQIIISIEEINREEKLAYISSEDSTVRCRKISNDFFAKHGIWPYVTKTHNAFYKSFYNQ